jgi:hypothetical protein
MSTSTGSIEILLDGPWCPILYRAKQRDRDGMPIFRHSEKPTSFRDVEHPVMREGTSLFYAGFAPIFI